MENEKTNSFEFKPGDKFDPSRNAIVRTQTDENGVLSTTYITVNPYLIGWSLIPGVGIKSPAPEDITLLADGSKIDMQRNVYISPTGVESAIQADKDGNFVCTVDMQLGADIVYKKDGDGFQFSKVDSGKSIESAEPLKLEEINDTFEKVFPFATETTSKTKAKAFNLMDATASYEFVTQIPKRGAKNPGTKTKITSTITINKDQQEMFAMSNGTRLLSENSAYFLEFEPSAEVKAYLESEEGKKEQVEVTEEGTYKFKVDECFLSNANGFHVTALGGKIRFDANAVASVIKIDDMVFAHEHAEDKRGCDITMSAKFIEEAYSGSNPVLKSGSYAKRGEQIDELDYTKVASKMPVDTFLALANLGEEKDGIKTYGDEKSSIQVFLGSVKGDEKGSQSSLMLVRIGNEHYIYHDCALVRLRDDRTCEFAKDGTRGAMKFSPAEGGKDIKGNQIAILGKKTEENTKVFAEANKFLGAKASSQKLTGRMTGATTVEDVTKNVQIIKSNEKRNINVNTEIVEPTIEPPKKDKEDDKQPPKKEDTPEKKEEKPYDKKKATNFWDTLANANWFAMMFCLIGAMFGLGFVTMPLAIAFGAAGFLCKGIAWQGGFGPKAEKQAIAAASKKENEKKRKRVVEKYRERIKLIDDNKAKITQLKSQLEVYESKGMKDSADAQKLQSQIAALEKKNAKLETKNSKARKKASNRTLLDFMGDRPKIEDIGSTGMKLMDTLSYDEVETLKEMTPAERAQLWSELDEYDEKYGGASDADFVLDGIKQQRIRERCEKTGTPMTEEEKEFCSKYEKSLEEAQGDLGPMYDAWKSHIIESGQLILQREQEVEHDYQIPHNVSGTLSDQIKELEELNEKLNDIFLTPAQRDEAKARAAELSKSIEKTKKSVRRFWDSYRDDMEGIITNEVSSPEMQEELLKSLPKKISDKAMLTPEIDELLFIAKSTTLLEQTHLGNPITRKLQAVDVYISELDSSFHTEKEKQKHERDDREGSPIYEEEFDRDKSDDYEKDDENFDRNNKKKKQKNDKDKGKDK